MTRRPVEKAQRLRLRFACRIEEAGVGHLEMTRSWARAFDEAGIALSYSDGNRQQPRLNMAAGLAMGVTSDGELIDAILAERASPADVAQRLAGKLPPELTLLDVVEVGLRLPALPTLVRWADYEVDLPHCDDARAAVDAFLGLDTLPWEDTRGEKVRRYDIRSLVQDVRVASCDGATRLTLRLRCDATGVGRAEQVVKALGLPQPVRIHRLRLVLDEPSPAREAWRRRGRFA